MITYVTVQISSEGAKASKVNEIMTEIGFEATLGTHDFMYKWKEKNITAERVISFVDSVQAKMKGTGVMMHFTTIR